MSFMQHQLLQNACQLAPVQLSYDQLLVRHKLVRHKLVRHKLLASACWDQLVH